MKKPWLCAACPPLGGWWAAGLLAWLLVLPSPARTQGIVILLDFSSTATDIHGETTGAFDASAFRFSAMDQPQVENAVLAAVAHHYLGYPTSRADGASPLLPGKTLDIGFGVGSVGTTAANTANTWYVKVGTRLQGVSAAKFKAFGMACVSCVRGGGLGEPVGSLVGSVWTDQLAAWAALAEDDDAGLVHLIAGTVSHEIGHALGLGHARAQGSNPGSSRWDLMGSRVSSMPHAERVLPREFSYANFATLMDHIGLRNVDPAMDITESELAASTVLLLAVAALRATPFALAWWARRA